MVGQKSKIAIKIMIENSRTKLEEYKDDFKSGIEKELEWIRDSEQKNSIDVLSSCLSVVSMALKKCRDALPWHVREELSNRQLVSYCLLVDSIIKENEHSTGKGDLLEIVVMAKTVI